MRNLRVRRVGDPVVHAAQWHDDEGGRAWCGPYFTLCHSDARAVEDDISCMSCLVKAARQKFQSHYDAVMHLSNEE